MSTSTSPRPVNAKFPGDPQNTAEIVNDLRQIVYNAQKSAEWANAPQVQVAINTLSTDADDIEQRELLIEQLRAQLAQAEEVQAKKLIACKQHRKQAEATVTVASGGLVETVKAWGCVVVERNRRPMTDEAPQNLSVKNTRTPGDVVARCKGVRARAYVFQHADDPTFPAGAPAPVILPNATYTLTGLSAGQKVYVRVAVIRQVTGQSKWSEPVQLTVR